MDNKIAAWDASAIRQELLRLKLDSKMTALGMAYSPRYMNAAGAANLLIASGSPLVLAMHTLTGSMRPVANLQGLIPAGAPQPLLACWPAACLCTSAIACSILR